MGSSIDIWVEDRITLAKKSIHAGTELNPFYLPDFIHQLSRLMEEFPLWTSVTLPYEAEHATSAYVEGYFNDLKTRVFKHYTKTIRANIYLKAHALDIIGGTLLFMSKRRYD